VELPFAPSAAETTDLLGRAIAGARPIQRSGRTLAVELAPWEILTLRLHTQLPEPLHPRWRR
jgi:hypothetical protein